MRYSSLLFFLLVFTLTTLPQNFTGMKFALDPGHGSPHGATCEPETKRYEAWMNHIVMPYLKQMLQRDGATVFSTRGDFDSLGACITLSEREAVANNNNVDFFHSIHHNAFTGTSNYSLVLFEQLNNTICPNGNPQWPGQADSMAIYMAAELFAGLQTTVGYPRGDYCFLGYNLGVLNNLNMPGVLSEGSFFDFPAEILRLANLDYLKTEAEAQYLSYLKYYKKPLPAHGSLVGLVTNLSSGNPVKGVQVVLTSLGKTYNVDTLGNGFYRFDSLAPGTYPISVYSNLDTTNTNVTIVAGKINKKNLLSGSADAPPPVKLLSVTGSDGALNLRWEQPTGLVDSILIYLSENGTPPTGAPFKSLAGNVTTHTLTGLTSGETYYVALKAKNLFGESPYISKVYGALASTIGDQVLLVDGFNRYGGSGSWQQPYHNFTSYYGEALAQLPRRFSTVANTAITSSSQIKPFKYLFWLLGDESTVDETFSTTEQTMVKEYLQNGGKLFVTGSEVAWDLDSRGTATDKEFFNQFFKAAYGADNPTPNTPSATGAPLSIFDGVSVTFGQTYPEDWPDVITAANGSSVIMNYNSTQAAAVAFDGTFPSGTNPGKLVFVAFTVETIGDAAKRKLMVEKIMNFFTGATSIDDLGNELVPTTFSMSVHPNPFNPSTNLTVGLVEDGIYQIKLFDILGRELMTVNEGFMQKGSHLYRVDMNTYPSGTYFIHVSGANVNSVQKILLLK
ncbi:MAG: N-acetylmuramoyl-L-alanine amidase [Ignavibacteriaceae bacterium]|nr:N-acetylmuramoyl-L-alanine amidase [Ignavibacteriaceae bacterium]